jgi:hypothetical protein
MALSLQHSSAVHEADGAKVEIALRTVKVGARTEDEVKGPQRAVPLRRSWRRARYGRPSWSSGWRPLRCGVPAARRDGVSLQHALRCLAQKRLIVRREQRQVLQEELRRLRALLEETRRNMPKEVPARRAPHTAPAPALSSARCAVLWPQEDSEIELLRMSVRVVRRPPPAPSPAIHAAYTGSAQGAGGVARSASRGRVHQASATVRAAPRVAGPAGRQSRADGAQRPVEPLHGHDPRLRARRHGRGREAHLAPAEHAA